MVAEEPGGLFYARQGQQYDCLVVSSSRAAAALNELVVEPDLKGAPETLPALLLILVLWHEARLAGPLADSRRDLIERRLLDRLYLLLCGSRWSHAEEAFFDCPVGHDFQQLERAIEARMPSFAVVLRQACAMMQQGTSSGARWFAEVADRYGISHDPVLCRFALRLASDPFALGKEADSLFDGIRQNGPLMRGARLVALRSLAADHDHPGSSLPRWTW